MLCVLLSCLMSDDLGYASLVDTMLCPKFVTHFPKVGKLISCDN